jgi:chromosome segregation ATPase
MSIEREQIEQRRDVLQDDINNARQRIAEYEKKKTEDIALLNALQGAIQQCDFFLKELDNDKSEMAGDDGNDSLAVS